MFEKGVVQEGVERADMDDLPGVSAGEDILGTMSGVIDDVKDMIAKFQGVDIAGESEELAVPRKNLNRRLRSLESRLVLVRAELRQPERDDLLKLLEDPLSSETRATRRNVGALSVLAVLVGLAGKAPESFLGFGIKTFRGWEFPVLVGVVIVYEFVAFRLYIRADIARRKIHYERAARHNEFLEGHLETVNAFRGHLSDFLHRNAAVYAGRVLGKFDDVAKQWKNDVDSFRREFAIQRHRGGWDIHVPTILVVASLLALLSMLRSSGVVGVIEPLRR